MLVTGRPEYRTREKSILIIDNDVPRTFARLSGFSTEDNMKALSSILQAFAMYRPDVGYVQGMSYIAAMLLNANAESGRGSDTFMSFVSFSALVTKFPILPFYTFNDVLIRKIL